MHRTHNIICITDYQLFEESYSENNIALRCQWFLVNLVERTNLHFKKNLQKHFKEKCFACRALAMLRSNKIGIALGISATASRR